MLVAKLLIQSVTLERDVGSLHQLRTGGQPVPPCGGALGHLLQTVLQPGMDDVPTAYLCQSRDETPDPTMV